MTALQKFTFNDAFELKDSASGNSDGVRYAEVYGRAELDAAREEGMRAGAAQERATSERLQAEALTLISQRLEAIAQQQAAAIEGLSKEAIALALVVARKVATHLISQQPSVEIEGLFADCLQQLIDEPRIAVRVPDALLDGLKGRIEEISAGCGFEGKVVLLADPSLSASDCTLEWADGGAERNAEAIWSDIETRIGIGPAAPDGHDDPTNSKQAQTETTPPDGS